MGYRLPPGVSYSMNGYDASELTKKYETGEQTVLPGDEVTPKWERKYKLTVTLLSFSMSQLTNKQARAEAYKYRRYSPVITEIESE